jgi:hypothetical protein
MPIAPMTDRYIHRGVLLASTADLDKVGARDGTTASRRSITAPIHPREDVMCVVKVNFRRPGVIGTAIVPILSQPARTRTRVSGHSRTATST